MQTKAKKTRPYYSLVTREAGTWSVQFGDYERDVVAAEADDVAYSENLKKRDVRIIKTADTQAAIEAKVATLNGRPGKPSAQGGYVIYRGPSLIDGQPIVAVAIVKSSNSKTGNMVQTYIMRADLDPRDANRTGADYSVCGNCPHRGTPGPVTRKKGEILASGRTCYVTMGQGPLIVFNTLQRGKYREATTAEARRAIGMGRMVRIGTYGDGAAVPGDVWSDLVSEATGHTAYSHQADMPGTSFDPAFYMVSADTIETAQKAWAAGRRTFRIVSDVADVRRDHEAVCPASAEAGKKATCDKCKLCGGAAVRAKSIAIVAHGSGAKYFGQAVQ